MLRYYIKDYIVYVIYNIVLLTVAALLNRFYQVLIFILFFEIIQNSFKYRFHADTIEHNPSKAVKLCKIITIIVELLYLITCSSLDISVYSNILIIFLIAFTNCLLQIALENLCISYDALKDKHILLHLCKKANLSKSATDRLYAKYIDGKTYQEIADTEYVDIETIKKSILRSKKKIFKKP